MANIEIPNCLVADTLENSTLYSEELGINLPSRKDSELFKWFLASILFGNRISEDIAKKTYRAFEKYDILQPEDIIGAGWLFLVNPVMKEGGYVRYDEKTSSQLLKNCKKLLDDFSGSLNALHDSSNNPDDLEELIQEYYGIGPVTCNIFLRELRPYWHNSDPAPLPVVRELSKCYQIKLMDYDRKSIKYVRLEAGLIRQRTQLKHQHHE